MAPPPPPPPPELNDDVTVLILLRISPDEPADLFRAALVCKPWLRVLCDPAFLRRYRSFHGAPPLLGVLHRLDSRYADPRLVPTTAVPLPAFPYPAPASGGRRRPLALDCRHGRVLLHMLTDERRMQRKVNAEGVAEWMCRISKLDTMVPIANPKHEGCVLGFAEDLCVIFVSTSVGIFAINLKSGKVRKVDMPRACLSVLPYTSFYTPDGSKLSLLARTN